MKASTIKAEKSVIERVLAFLAVCRNECADRNEVLAALRMEQKLVKRLTALGGAEVHHQPSETPKELAAH